MVQWLDAGYTRNSSMPLSSLACRCLLHATSLDPIQSFPNLFVFPIYPTTPEYSSLFPSPFVPGSVYKFEHKRLDGPMAIQILDYAMYR